MDVAVVAENDALRRVEETMQDELSGSEEELAFSASVLAVAFLLHRPAWVGIPLGLMLVVTGTLGDLAGGWFSDHVLRRTGNVNLARRWVAIAGFLLSAAATIPA